MVGSSQELDLQLLMYGEKNNVLIDEIKSELASLTSMDDMVASAKKKGKGKPPPAKQVRGGAHTQICRIAKTTHTLSLLDPAVDDTTEYN